MTVCCFLDINQPNPNPNNTVAVSINDTIPTVFTLMVGLETPEIKPNKNVVLHTEFSFVFNDAHKRSNWVACCAG
jgi:hypothetical protein